MTREQRIHDALTTAFAPEVLGVENESHTHSVAPGSETHFKVLVVSRAFDGKSRVERQRLVQDLLASELRSGLHALSMRLLTPEQYAEGGASGFVSPACLGGSKRG
jgi:BolA protein